MRGRLARLPVSSLLSLPTHIVVFLLSIITMVHDFGLPPTQTLLREGQGSPWLTPAELLQLRDVNASPQLVLILLPYTKPKQPSRYEAATLGSALPSATCPPPLHVLCRRVLLRPQQGRHAPRTRRTPEHGRPAASQQPPRFFIFRMRIPRRVGHSG